MRVLSHDAFARHELVKDAPQPTDCTWCGRRDRSGRSWVFYYRADDQLGTVHPRYTNLKRFCSVSCFRTFNA
jgi:hypothetical protein